MAMDRGDREWLTDQFGAVHARINEANEERSKADTELRLRIEEVNTSVKVHKALPCQDVIEHVKERHNIAKQVTLLGGIAALSAAAWEGFKFLVSKATGHS